MHLKILLLIGQQAGSESTSVPFWAYLDTWIISGLVLLAVVVAVAKWLWGRFTRDDAEYDSVYEDDYYPDEC